MFSVKLKDWKRPFILFIVGGVCAAVVVSVISAFLGFTLTSATIYWLWAVMLILVLIKSRFLSIIYSSSIVAILHLTATIIGPLPLENDIAAIYQSLLDINVGSLLVVSALLYLAQSLLVRIQFQQLVTPVYLSGKRGKVIGGYALQGYWPAPLLLFVPVSDQANGTFVFDATVAQPFFLDITAAAWILLACPLMLGVSQLSTSLTPKQLAIRTSKQGIIISVIAIVLAIGAWWLSPLLWVTAIFMLVATEVVQIYNTWKEAASSLYYAQDDRGLKVLAIVKDSPAQQMQVQVGDIIVKANGISVHSLEQLYEAMSTNPAFCKLELLDEQGEIKFASRTRYADEHHQLGIILVPDQQSNVYTKYIEPSIFTWLSSKRKYHVHSSSKSTISK